MSGLTVSNWFGDIVSHPAVIVDAHSVEDIVNVMRHPERYPPPVRAVGSNHSTTPCGVAEPGTLVRMRMNRVVELTEDSLTVEAGATHLDMARLLEQHELQFFVNTEIGSLTAGSAACAGTKDASMPGEYGQVGSYVTGARLVLPNGELLHVTEAAQPDLMRALRSSYGTFGIVYEVTYRIRPLTALAVHHKTFTIEDFLAMLPELKALGYSMMYYFFPFEELITVEFRRYNPDAKGEPDRTVWALRNHTWGTSGPKLARTVGKTISRPRLRYGIIDKFNALWRFQLENIVRSENTSPPDQIIHYPETAGDSRYTFSLFAFPEAEFPDVLREFVKLCQEYYASHGYRSDLLYVGYAIARDDKSLLSYSGAGDVMTIDPVSTGNDGWREFLAVYNEFCSARNGQPLLNQTFGVTPAIARRAYGGRLQALEDLRRGFDPQGRLLNDYLRSILQGASSAATA